MAERRHIKTIPEELTINKIFLIGKQKVMLDFDVAAMYGVETRRLNEQVKRNIEKFPPEFIFRLTAKEWKNMMSQFATSSLTPEFVNSPKKKVKSQNATSSQKKRKIASPPFAFTEHGVAMAATVLKSERAAKMSVAIVKAFIQLRQTILNYADLAREVKNLKLKIDGHDVQLNQIYEAIENLLDEKVEAKNWEGRKRIGFKVPT